MPATTDAPPPWERQPTESPTWYARFHNHYLLLGSERSVEAAWRDWKAKDAKGKTTKGVNPGRGWWETANRQNWRERATQWDAQQQRRHRDSVIEETRKLQEKHKNVLRHLFNQTLKAAMKVDADKMTDDQVLRWTERLISLERLVHNQPISVEQINHAGPGGGPMQSVTASAQGPLQDPAYLAEVMKILQAHNGLSDMTPAPTSPPTGADPDGNASHPAVEQ